MFLLLQAMQIVDRFLARPNCPTQEYLSSRKQYQLLVMAALYIAIKTNEPVVLGADVLSATSDGLYTEEEIHCMEMIILQGLEWRIYSAPTGIQMCHYILSLLLPHVKLDESMWGFLLDEVTFQTESAVRDYYFSTQRPSTVALAALFNALDQVDSQIRQDVLRALLLLLDNKFDHPRALLDAKNRLKCLVEGDGVVEEDVSMAEVPRTVSVPVPARIEDDDEPMEPKPKNSPRSVLSSSLREKNTEMTASFITVV